MFYISKLMRMIQYIVSQTNHKFIYKYYKIFYYKSEPIPQRHKHAVPTIEKCIYKSIDCVSFGLNDYCF